MSDKLGPLTFGKKEEQIFLGREIAQHRDYSESTAQAIDAEVKSIVLAGYRRARQILEKNAEALSRIAEALLEREVLDAEQISALVRGEELAKTGSSSGVESTETTEETAKVSKPEKDEGPGVLPAPGNQPA